MHGERSSFGSIVAIVIILVLLVAGAVYAVKMRRETTANYVPAYLRAKEGGSATSSSQDGNLDLPHEDLSSEIDAELRALEATR